MSTEPYSIRADSEIIQDLGLIAKSMDRSRNWVINEALKAYVNDYKWLQDQVEKSRQELAAGKGISHDEAMARIRKKLDGRV